MKNFTTRLLFVTLFICFSFSILSRKSQAASFTSSKQIYLLENGDYLETIITGTPAFSNNISYLSSSKSITKTKTSKYKSKNGLTLWSVSIKATFTYNGRTSVPLILIVQHALPPHGKLKLLLQAKEALPQPQRQLQFIQITMSKKNSQNLLPFPVIVMVSYPNLYPSVMKKN